MNQNYLFLCTFYMKKDTIASLLMISQDMILTQADKSSETNVEAGGRVLEKKCFICNTRT